LYQIGQRRYERVSGKSWIYRLPAFSNDVNAARKGRLGRRIGRRLYGKVTGRIARRLFG
jgi:hypothetical protein